ncbi:SusD, outer membrane protein [Arcticibacter svalbardensis MN12-7]|uniref:SusD, outer membrane protein n=1 Tax=Arcticibacter svalbardensis MN12-7 TaxID=1150600 RepID=R9GM63_9SPHI|nr:RagB/SusD family nutrient uptake outer membrane protein [Arcticibacter svalbardensis]EOR92818.1 SusD, outer membrane protein [Arcticibacter svalbardensis MN12-7]
MKKIYQLTIGVILTSLALSSCHKLEVPVKSQLTSAVFPTTPDQYNSIIGAIYTRFRQDYSVGFWQVQSHSTDESVQPAYGGNWFDGGRYMQLHLHTWNKDNALLSVVYSYFSDMIGMSNQSLYILQDSPAGDTKTESIAQIRTMRAYAYFQLMDMFGSVPLDTIYGSKVTQANAPREEIFNFIESELKQAIPNLSPTKDGQTYGKANRYTAFALLAKLYINAAIYTGTPRWNETVNACDSVINAGGGILYGFEFRDKYLSMFYPENGSTNKEFIFAIPYDASTSSGYMFHARYDLNRNLGMKYHYSGATVGSNIDPVINLTTGNGLVNTKPSGPRMTTAEYFSNFNDPNDIRNQQWLSGKQYWADGNPIMVKTTKKGYDQFYAGSDGSASYTYQLELSPNFTLRQNPSTFDCGNDEIAWNMGTRNIKFLADYTNTISRNQNNDIPVFRYSDIILMKAEAILRGATPTNGQTALSLVNSLRANRTTSLAWTTVTLNDIYSERAREMAWETWRRNDMIRFGKFEDGYGVKTNTEAYRRIFPIPQSALSTNNKLVQNSGY